MAGHCHQEEFSKQLTSLWLTSTFFVCAGLFCFVSSKRLVCRNLHMTPTVLGHNSTCCNFLLRITAFRPTENRQAGFQWLRNVNFRLGYPWFCSDITRYRELLINYTFFQLIPEIAEEYTIFKSPLSNIGGHHCWLTKSVIQLESSPNADTAFVSNTCSEYVSKQWQTDVGANFRKGSILVSKWAR